MDEKQIRSYRMKTYRSLEGGYRSFAFVGVKRDIFVAITQPYVRKADAERALVGLMRRRKHSMVP